MLELHGSVSSPNLWRSSRFSAISRQHVHASRSSNGTRRTLYHSELAKLGTTRIKLLSQPLDILYPDKPAYCFVQLEGSDQERTSAIENGEIYETLLHTPLDQWLTVQALGSRDAAVPP